MNGSAPQNNGWHLVKLRTVFFPTALFTCPPLLCLLLRGGTQPGMTNKTSGLAGSGPGPHRDVHFLHIPSAVHGDRPLTAHCFLQYIYNKTLITS